MHDQERKLPGPEKKLFNRDIVCCNISRSPGILKIKASCNAIYIQYLSCEEQVRYFSAHHSLSIYFTKEYSSCGYKFLFISRFPFYFQLISTQIFNQFVLLFGRYFCPSYII